MSPLISPPSPLDFRRGRGMPSLDPDLLFGLGRFREETLGNGSKVGDIDKL